MPREDDISPYLKRPLRSLDEVLRLHGVPRGARPLPPANSDQPPTAVPPAKSA